MAKKSKEKNFRKKETDAKPLLAEREWRAICENLKVAMLHGLPDLGFFPVMHSGIKQEIPEGNGESCAVEFAASPGFLARLSFADPARAQAWEKSYEEQIAAALAQFSGDEEKFALDWEPVFTDCGKLRIQIDFLGFRTSFDALFGASATVYDENGAEIGKYNICAQSLFTNFEILEDFTENNIGIFCDTICLNALLPEYSMLTAQRDALSKALLGVSLEFFVRSEWEAIRHQDWKECATMFFNPLSPLNVEGPQKARVEEITGTLEKPAFPQEEAIYVLCARSAKPTDYEYNIKVTGPWPYQAGHFARYPELLRKAVEDTENIVFQETFRPEFNENSEDPVSEQFYSGKHLADRIKKALGAGYGEDK